MSTTIPHRGLARIVALLLVGLGGCAVPAGSTRPNADPPSSSAVSGGDPAGSADGDAGPTSATAAAEAADAGSPSAQTVDSSSTVAAAGSPGAPTPAIDVMADLGSWEAPQAVFVAALPPVPHACFSDGVNVGTQTQVPRGVDVEGPNALSYQTPTGAPTANEITVTKAIRACLRQRDLAYYGAASANLLGGGDALKASFQWDFGDPGAPFDTVAGVSAAHLYEAPGTYTITLTVTNELGLSGKATAQVKVLASTRQVIDVATQSDLDAVASSPGSGREIRLARGGSFKLASALPLGSNDHLTAYGTGSAPVLECASCTGMFDLNHATLVHDVIEHLQVRVQAGTEQPIMTEPAGTNTVLSDVSFTRDPSSAHAYKGPGRFVTVYGEGVLLQGDGAAHAADGSWTTDGLKDNFAFIQGSHVALYGNHVYEDADDANAEPAIRTCSAGLAFVSIVSNEIGGFFGKANEVTLRAGHNLYVGSNTILGGVMDVRDGCTPLGLTPGESTANVVLEANHTENTQVAITTPGVYGVMERNEFEHRTVTPNATYPTQGDSLAAVSGPDAVGTSERIFFVNNTFLFEPDIGKVFDFGGDGTAGTITLVNNLVFAPALAPAKRPVINMPTGANAMQLFARVDGNAFLLTPEPTLAKTAITLALTFEDWNAATLASGAHPSDLAFDEAAGGFAGAAGGSSGLEAEYEAYRPTLGAAFAASATNLAAPPSPAAGTDTLGVTDDLGGLARPAHGAGGWTPGALQAQ